MNKLLKLLFFIIITLLSIYIIRFSKENKILKANMHNLEKQVFLLQQKLEDKFLSSQTELVSLLKTYIVFDKNGELKLSRMGKATGDGGYVIPNKSIDNADVLLGYGISDDISFEEEFSSKFHKKSFGFDCSITTIETNNNLVKFIPECLGTSDYSDHKISTNISTFKEQLQKLDLENKKIFIKMDIEGAEYEVFSDILNDTRNITGIAMELHLNTWTNNFEKAISLLSAINQHFYLVNVHGNNCSEETFEAKNVEGGVSRLLQLTYINKNLVTHAKPEKITLHPSKHDIPNCSDKKEHKFKIVY